MKRIIPAILVFFLAACSAAQAERDLAATEQAQMTRIAEAVQATGTAMAGKTLAAPTSTPIPIKKTLDEALLDGTAMNVLLGIWPLEPSQSMVPSSNPLCLMTCAQDLWVSTDGKATLQISLFEKDNRDQVVTELRDIKSSQEILGVKELELPDYTQLPTDTWIQDNGSTGSRYTMHTRKGSVLIILTIFLPQYDQEQNVLFLTLYADQQIKMLETAGW